MLCQTIICNVAASRDKQKFVKPLILILQCARQGFALGLTILLGTISNIKVDSLLKLVNDLLEVTSSMRGQVVLNHLKLFKELIS